MSYHLFTSETVSEGHPDKICDQISEAHAQVDCEAFAYTDCIHLAGQITSSAQVLAVCP